MVNEGEVDKRPMQPPFPIKTVGTDDLDLDLRNSRFPRDAQSQDDALHLMMVTAGEECLELLRDMAKSGELHSADLPIVVPKNARFVVMEGNRRLTCLRIWGDPSVLASDRDTERAYRSRVERVVADSPFAPPTEVRVVVAPSETAADPWIDRKHAGGAGGAGTVQWGPAMKDRRKARNDPTAASRAMAFIELVSTQLEDEHDIQADLETVRTSRYTMIQRFVDRSIVRDRLGLEFSAGRMTFAHGATATTEIVRAVLHDFAQPKATTGKTWARELDTVADFASYLDGYAHLLPGAGGGASDSPGGSDTAGEPHRPEAPGDPHNLPPSDEPGDDGKDPRPKRPTPPQSNIFRGLVLDKFTNRIQEIVRQTAQLNVQRQTEVVSVLLRVVLDLTTYQFLNSHGMKPAGRLDKNLHSAIKTIEPDAAGPLGSAETTSALRKAYHATTSNSIRMVQYAVHDVHSGHTPNEVLTLAARYEPVLVAMNEHMGNNPLA